MAVASIDTIPHQELEGQSVLVRIDAEDDTNLRRSLSTLALAAEAGARIVVATHYGLPAEAPRVDAIAARLGELLGRSVGKLDEWQGEAGLRAVSHLDAGDIVMVENLAFEPGEETGDDKLAEALGRLCDIYCNDAFALSHQVRASTVGVAKRAKRAVAGLAFERELSILEIMLGEPRHPSVALLGGQVSKEKLLLAEEIARHADRTLVAGELAFPFLIARERFVNSAAVTEEMVVIAERMIREAADNNRILSTPADFIVVDIETFGHLSHGQRPGPENPLKNVTENELGTDQIICDIGTATRWSWSDGFGPARTIFWHGPVGICEIDLFCEGSRFFATELAKRTWPTVHRTVVCGRSLISGLRRVGFPTEEIRHVSHGGRAALHYFAGRPLPAVDVLNQMENATPKPFRVLIPLSGSERDVSSLEAAADTVASRAEIVLLHVRSGLDEEQYPDLGARLSETERLEHRIESERIFARANAILAGRGLVATRQLAVRGRPAKIILRYARRLQAELLVLAAESDVVGAAARRMIDGAPCATLVARPR
jgi:phosphoglycerate kinase